MREDSEFVHHVILPNNVCVFGAGLNFGFAGTDVILAFVFERPVVAIGKSVHIEANDFAAAGDAINAIAFNGGRREQTEIFPVVDFAGGEFGNDQLPDEFAGFFVKNHQDAAVAGMFGIARSIVVGADENFAARHGDVAVALRAELGDPLH